MIAKPVDLTVLQDWIQQTLINPRSTLASDVNQVIEDSSRLLAIERLAVYQRSYYTRLLTCMREQFPALCYALGEALFNDFALEYLKNCPSDSYTLYELGRRFPQYLQDTRPDQALSEQQQETWVNFMIDLVRFECLVFTLFDAPGCESATLASEQTDDYLLALQPCFELGSYRFDVAAYYHGVRKKEKPSLPSLKPSLVALVRKDFLTQTLTLSEAHYTFLNALAMCHSVEESLEQVANQLGLSLEQVTSSWLDKNGVRQRWIEAGIFVDKSKDAE